MKTQNQNQQKVSRVYNVFTHYDAAPYRVRATSPAAALAAGLELAAAKPPRFRSLVTELPGTEGGGYNYRDCQPLPAPRAVRATDQFGRTDS